MAGLLYIRTGNAGTDPAVAIDDLGISIATTATWKLLSMTSPGDPTGNSGQFTSRELRDSDDLYTQITTGALEWSKDGIAVEATGDYVADYSIFQDFSDDYLDLTSGRLTLPNGATLPLSGDEGEIFWDSTADALYMWNGTSWIDVTDIVASGVDHGLLVGLADDDHSQYLLLGGTEARNQVTGSIDMGPSGGYFILPQATDVNATFTAGSEGALAWDTDDEALYAHDGANWFAIAPASGIVTDHSGLTGLTADDHPQYGLLAGNTARNAVTGTYDFNAGDIILPVDGTTPVGTADGQTSVVAGLLSTYDGTRAKWISVDRKLLTASKEDHAENVYLRIGDALASSKTGYRALRNGTITGLFAQTSAVGTWTLEIRKNGAATVIASLVITAANGGQAITTNVDFSQGDELQFFANTAGGEVEDPVAGMEIAWRV